jgi:hypothetical protein
MPFNGGVTEGADVYGCWRRDVGDRGETLFSTEEAFQNSTPRHDD